MSGNSDAIVGSMVATIFAPVDSKSKTSCFSLLKMIAFDEQAKTQEPQPMHLEYNTSGICPPAVILIALTGQALTHA